MTGKKVFMEVNRMDGSSESIPLGPERWYLNITAEMSHPFGSFFSMVKYEVKNSGGNADAL